MSKKSNNEALKDEFVRSWESNDIKNRMLMATVNVDRDVDSALETFVQCLKESSRCMFKHNLF